MLPWRNCVVIAAVFAAVLTLSIQPGGSELGLGQDLQNKSCGTRMFSSSHSKNLSLERQSSVGDSWSYRPSTVPDVVQLLWLHRCRY